jgi:hypothetical protein
MRRLALILSLTFTFAMFAAYSLEAQGPALSGVLGTADRLKGTAEAPGQAAVESAAAAKKFIFVMFWKEKNAQTDKVWGTLQAAAAKYADTAEVASIQTTDPAEKAIVDRFKVSKAPMPLVLAVAPCGAVTKAFQGNLEEKQLAVAFVSPCEQLCMKAIQDSKLVFVCVVYETPKDGDPTIPEGIKDFQEDKKYTKVTEVVLLNATDKNEADFLKELKINTKAQKPVSVLLAPGAMIGTFDVSATKQQIVSKLAAAQSGCCPGGKCGPGGCGPKK